MMFIGMSLLGDSSFPHKHIRRLIQIVMDLVRVLLRLLMRLVAVAIAVVVAGTVGYFASSSDKAAVFVATAGTVLQVLLALRRRGGSE